MRSIVKKPEEINGNQYNLGEVYQTGRVPDSGLFIIVWMKSLDARNQFASISGGVGEVTRPHMITYKAFSLRFL